MSKPKKQTPLQLFAAVCGIVGPLIMAVGMLAAALAYRGKSGQSYSILNHFVSELGELGVSNLAWAFNWSLIAGGILATIFMIYLAAQLRTWIKYPLGLLSVIATLSGGLVGVFPMNSLAPHLRAALTFFNLGMLVSLIYSLVILFGGKHPFPKWLSIPGLLSTAAFTLFLYYPSEIDSTDINFQDAMAKLFANRPDFIPLALMEWSVIIGILIWIAMLAAYLFFYQPVSHKAK